VSYRSLVIASDAKQSGAMSLDCFAAALLAMALTE
jgi:hypothetical protein